MTFQKNWRHLFLFLIVLSYVEGWTIDLPEVRRYWFEKSDINKIKKNDYQDYVNSERSVYSNIQGNSPHNSKGSYDVEKYADDFAHQPYMEKKVQHIVHDGSAYLEGLRRSLEDYSRFLEQCNRGNATNLQNTTSVNSTWAPPAANTANWTFPVNSTDLRFQGFNSTKWPLYRSGNTTGGATRRPRMRMSCREATEASEKVRRYADLAMWVTRRLQDLTYAGQYQKTDKYEENELILKLAWFLDQLAVLTGYEPDHTQFLPQTTTTTSTSAPMAPTFVPQTQEMINYMTMCLKVSSSVPATIRCRYPLPIPEMVSQIIAGTSTPSPPPTDTNVSPIPSDSNPQQSLELLITSADYRNPHKIAKRSPEPDEYFEYHVPLPVHEKPKPFVDFIVKKLSNLKAIVKNVKKHAVADFASQLAVHKHHIHKRSISENPVLLNVLAIDEKPSVKIDKPAVKMIQPIHLPILDVSIINTKSFKKRSLDDNDSLNKKNTDNPYEAAIKSVRKRFIDDPMTKLAKYYVKYKVWDNSNPLTETKNKISSNFDVNNSLQPKTISKRSIFYKKYKHLRIPKLLQIIYSNNDKHRRVYSAKKGKAKLLHYVNKILEKQHKIFNKSPHKIGKRSLIYEDLYLPRIPTNPVGDISYYVKNKEGRNYNPSLTQAAQVRLGLQQAFETGNIEVIHRYGSNYNPANPAPFYTGVLKTMADA